MGKIIKPTPLEQVLVMWGHVRLDPDLQKMRKLMANKKVLNNDAVQQYRIALEKLDAAFKQHFEQ